MMTRLLTLFLLFTCLTIPSISVADKVLVYAAASTTNAVNEAIKSYHLKHPETQIKVSFASSSTLAKQIEMGAPAHIYISANPTWMDYLQKKDFIKNKSRTNLLSNQLVLISPKGKRFEVEMTAGFNFSEKIKGKICLGDPDHVPVGIYAKQAMVSLGWWEQIKTQVVGNKDVRAALVLVELGECAAGIVYSTDTKVSDKIDLIARFPAENHAPIVYPIAALNTASKSALDFLNYLKSPEASSLFNKHGFIATR